MQLSSLPALPAQNNRLPLPSEPSRVAAGFLGKFLSPWSPITGAQGCRGQHLRHSLDLFPQSLNGSHGARFIFLGTSERRGEGWYQQSLPLSSEEQSFPRSPSKLLMSHLLPLPVRGAVKVVRFSSLLREGQGELSMDAGRHPVVCARSPFQLCKPGSPKVQPFLSTMMEVIHGYSHHMPKH